MASVTQRTTTTGTVWQVRYRHGTRHRARSFTTQAMATKWAALLTVIGPDRANEALSMPKIATARTVAEQVEAHITARTGITEGTRSDYRSYLTNEIGPRLGAIPLPLLDRAAVAAWVNDMAARGLSGKSIRNRHSLLSGALTTAQLDRLITEHPCKGMRMPRTDHTVQEMVCLTHREFADIVARMPAHWQPLALMLAGTGMRFGEATALTVGDIHTTYDGGRERWVARVTKAWQHTDGHGHRVGPPKSKKSNRTVRVPLVVIARLELERPSSDYLFVTPAGGPVRSQRFHEVWRASVEHMERRPRVHDLRHSYASWQIIAGTPLPILQRQLGHEQVSTTVDTYGHLAPADFDMLSDIASRALGPA